MTTRPAAHPPDLAHVRDVLARSGPLADASPEAREAVRERLIWLYLPGGEVLFGPGDPQQGVYFVVHGRLRAYIDADRSGTFERHEAVADLEPGGCAGLVGTLAGSPHRALVHATRDTEVGLLRATDLWALTEEHPDLLRCLARAVARRANATSHTRSAPQMVNVAIVPADPGAPLRAFGEALAAAVGALEPLLYVNAARFDAQLGPGSSADDVTAWDATDRRIVQWICAQEQAHRYVLYEADPTYTAWTQRCIRIADRVLIVARATSDPELTPGEEELFRRGDVTELVRKELVLLHDDDAELPEHTGRWMRRRPAVTRVHHVKLGNADHLRRLARFLTGRAVGLVLGGGGARGTAHMGAFQALRDVGIPVDLVGGTSAGAGVAGMVALDWDLATMRKRNRHAFVTLAPFKRYNLPYHSLMSKHGVEAAARYLFGDTRIEDLWLDAFAVSCDLLAGDMVVHREGPLFKAVLATTALPGVFPPVLHDGRLLVDGGIMDNNPVAVMRGLHDGPNVLINVGQGGLAMVDTQLDELPTNLESFAYRLLPASRRVKVPTVVEVVVRTMTVARPNAALDKLADLYVRPPVEGFGMMDFAAQDRLINIGYAATMDVLEAHREDAELLRRLGVDELPDPLPRSPPIPELPAVRK